MQKPRIVARIDLACLCSLIVAVFALIAPAASAQVTINPPQYPNLSLPYPDLYLNAAKNWQYQTSPANSASNATFLPGTPLTRVVGNVHWINIQPGYDRTKPVTDPDVNQPNWSNTLAGLGFNSGTGCTPTSSYWWQVAQCYPSKGNTAANPNNILYTFYTVPLWASAANGSHLSTDYTNTYDGWTVSGVDPNPPSGYVGIYLQGQNGPPNVAVGDNIVLSGNSYPGGQYTITLAPAVNGNVMDMYLPSGHTPNTAGYVTFTNSHPPSDVYSGASCTLPDGSVSPTPGDCFFKSYVTYVMMHTCGNQNLTTKPSSPLSTCVIHYWEGWNEFGGDLFWNGTYTRLAVMMVDADAIIHDYCSDCFFLAGTTANGGDGGHYVNPAARQGNNTSPDNSSEYLEGLGQLLRDWVDVAHQLPANYHKDIKPDAISFHPYWGGYDVYSPEAMPETNVPWNWDPAVGSYTGLQKCTGTTDIGGKYYGTPAGCVNICGRQYSYNSTTGVTSYTAINYGPTQGNGQLLGCSSYVPNPVNASYGTEAWPGCGTESIPSLYETRYNWIEPTNNPPADFLTQKPPVPFEPLQTCRDSFVGSIKAVQQLLPAISADSEVTQYVGANWFTNLPIWNTESGWGTFGDTSFAGLNALSATTDPKDKSLSTFIQQAYVARMSILAAQAGTAVNLWYQWDEDARNPSPDCKQAFSNWGKLGYDFPENYNSSCPTSDINDTLGPKVERAGYTFNRVYEWLQGLHFVSPGCAADPNNAGIWTCQISGNNGYVGLLVWYTPVDQRYDYRLPSSPAGLTCLKDIDGNLLLRSNGQTAWVYNRPVLFDNTPTASCTGTDPWPK